MEENEFQVEEQSSFLKFDKRVLLISLQKRIPLIITVTVIIAVLLGIWLKISVKNEWKATAIIIRHSKNLSSSSDVPYLYQQFDLNTVIEAIATRENLNAVIDSLDMDINYRQLFSHLSIKKGNKSNIIHLSATHLDRNKATGIANTLAEVFIKNYVNILNSSTKQIFIYYEQQKEIYLTQLKDIQDQLEGFRKEHGIVSPESASLIKYEQLNETELNLLETQMNINALQTKLDDIKKRLSDLPEQIAISYTVTSTKEGKLRELQNELTLLSQKYTDENPKIIKLRDEITQLKKEIAQSDNTILPDIVSYGEGTLRENLVIKMNEYENELKSSRELVVKYQNKIDGIKGELQSLSSLDNEYYKIKRKEDLTKDLLQTIDNRILEAKMSIGSNVSDFEVLQYAVPPDAPIGTGKKMILIAVSFMIFLGMTVFIAAKEFFDPTIKSGYDFDEILDLPLLVELPDKGFADENTFYTQMQIFLGKIRKFGTENRMKFLTVGSDENNVGKSMLTQDIIEMYNQKGHRTLWIESLPEREEEVKDHLINDVLFNKSATNPRIFNLTEGVDKLYYHHDERSLKILLDKEDIQQFINGFADYDLIIWELFPASINLQLFTSICSVSDLLILVARFGISNKNNLSSIMSFIKENCDTPMKGVLNYIEEPYYKRKY